MSAATTTIPAFLDAFAAQLRARPGLLDVGVFTAEMPEKNAGRRSIQFYTAGETQGWGALGKMRRDESYTVTGAIRIVVPGAGEEVIKAARDEAFRILAEIERQLATKPRVTDDVDSAQVVSADMDAGTNPEGRVCAVVFQIEVKASLEPKI